MRDVLVDYGVDSHGRSLLLRYTLLVGVITSVMCRRCFYGPLFDLDLSQYPSNSVRPPSYLHVGQSTD